MTSTPSAQKPSKIAPMSSAAVSPASPGHLPAYDEEPQIRDTSGLKWLESSLNAALATFLPKTPQSKPSKNPSETFETWVIDSRRYSNSVQKTLALRIQESGIGCWPKMLATLTARDWRSGKASPATHARNSRPLSEQLGGLLHPDFCDWYQGLPLGWTRAKHASRQRATARFQSWLRRHSAP